ncbi:acyl-CoA thioesterase [Mariniluteicoccus flavus]
MQPTAETMLAALMLTETAPELFDRAWTASTQYCPWPKAYGGDMVAQAAAAAMLSVTDDKVMHSMHSYFMRPVDIGAEVRYEVEILRDGRGYATRQARALQNGKVVYVALASFTTADPERSPSEGPSPERSPSEGPSPERSPSEGPSPERSPSEGPSPERSPSERQRVEEYHQSLPSGVPDPESLPSSAEVLDGVDGDAAAYWRGGRSFDMRHVPGAIYFEVDGEPVPHEGVWVKAFSALPESLGPLSGPDLQRAALAYVCDYTIIEPTLRRLGYAWQDEGLVTASLDHAMWFHRDARVDDWLFYAQESVSAQAQRGLGSGRFFDREGRLIATVLQEAMIRTP